MPQLINQGNLGEESVATDIKAISTVADSFRYPPDLIAGFEHRGGYATLPQLIGCRQPCWSRTDDDGRFSTHERFFTRDPKCGDSGVRRDAGFPNP